MRPFNHLMAYELFYLIAEAKESEFSKIKESVEKIVESEGGEWLEPEIIEKRKMAYKIKNQFRGIYIARRFEFVEKDTEEYKSDTIQNISKQIKLNPDILRFVIVKADDLPELKPHEIITGSKISRSFAERKKGGGAYFKKSNIDKTDEEKAPEEKPVDKKETKSIDEKLEEILKI